MSTKVRRVNNTTLVLPVDAMVVVSSERAMLWNCYAKEAAIFYHDAVQAMNRYHVAAALSMFRLNEKQTKHRLKQQDV